MSRTGSSSTRNPDDYFSAGFELLAGGGRPAVTIANLVSRLGVTKGSFYHHFQSVAQFQQALVLRWEERHVRSFMTRVKAIADPQARIRQLKQYALDLDHDAETAIRAWARDDELVADSQRRIDNAREHVLAETFVAAGVPDRHASVLARVGLTAMVGSQLLDRPIDRNRLASVLDAYEQWVLSFVEMAHLPTPGDTTGPRLGVS